MAQQINFRSQGLRVVGLLPFVCECERHAAKRMDSVFEAYYSACISRFRGYITCIAVQEIVIEYREARKATIIVGKNC